jgi:hypothetical protein
MRLTSIAFGAITLVAAFVAVDARREYRLEVLGTTELSNQLDEATKRIRDLESQLARTIPSIALVASGQVLASAEPVETAVTGHTLSFPTQAPVLNPVKRQQRFQQIRLQMAQRYPDLMSELGLTQGELGQLFDLLVKQQEERGAAGDTIRNLDEAQRIKLYAEMDKRQMAELSTLLGSRYSLYEQYKKTQSERLLVTSVRGLMESVGSPLRPDQVQSLTKTMIAERQRLQQNEQTLGRSQAHRTQSTEQYSNDIFALRTAADERVISIASAYLTQPQLEALQSQLESRTNRSRFDFIRP